MADDGTRAAAAATPGMVVGHVQTGASGGPAPPRGPAAGRDALQLTLAAVATTLIGVLITAILTRAFDQSDFGRWVVLIAAYSTAFVLVDLGLPLVLGRDVPRAPQTARVLMRRALGVQVIAAIVLIPGAWFVSLAIWGAPGWATAAFVLAVALAARVLSYAPGATLRALGEARQEAVGRVLDRLVTAIGFAMVLAFGLEGVLVLAIATAAGPAVTLVHQLLLAERHAGTRIVPGLEAREAVGTGALLHQALPYSLTLWIAPLIANLDKFLLSGFKGTAAVGLFNIGWTVYAAGLALPQAVRVALLPSFGEIQGHVEKTGTRLRAAQRLAWWTVPPGLLGGLVIVPPLIPIVFGADYLDARNVFLILLAAWGVSLIAAPQLVTVQARTSGWPFARMLGVALVTDLVVGLLLIPPFGVLGAAVSTLSAQVVLAGLTWWLSDAGGLTGTTVRAWLAISALLTFPFAALGLWELTVASALWWLALAGAVTILTGLAMALRWAPRPPLELLRARERVSDEAA